MRLSRDEARARFTAARRAVVGTVRPDGTPHLVPVTFACVGDEIVTAVDSKPKSTNRLQRLANLAAEPRTTALTEAYDEDWTRLWWARADGRARILDEDPEAVEWLRAKYEQYAAAPPAGPVIRIRVETWRGWSGER